jgi:hypothetical protein
MRMVVEPPLLEAETKEGAEEKGEDAEERRRGHGSPASTLKSTARRGTSGRGEGARPCFAPVGDKETKVAAMGRDQGGSPAAQLISPSSGLRGVQRQIWRLGGRI